MVVLVSDMQQLGLMEHSETMYADQTTVTNSIIGRNKNKISMESENPFKWRLSTLGDKQLPYENVIIDNEKGVFQPATFLRNDELTEVKFVN